MEFESFVTQTLKECIDSGIDQFIICPLGKRGLVVKNILNNQFGIQEYAAADNGLCKYNKNILPICELSKMDLNNTTVLLTSDNPQVCSELMHNVPIENVKFLVDTERKNDKDIIPKKNVVGRYSYGPLVENYEPLIDHIGSFCSFAPGCAVVGNHILDAVSSHEFLFAATNFDDFKWKKRGNWEAINKKVIIGNDVWLGANVLITNGARIGNGVIAGAGSIITKDIPDYAVVVGNPARILRFRFSEDQIEILNKIAWWNWPVEKIKENYEDFFDIDIFIERHGKNV